MKPIFLKYEIFSCSKKRSLNMEKQSCFDICSSNFLEEGTRTFFLSEFFMFWENISIFS